MKIVPVIDLRGGLVVRAVAGERAQYRPIQSQLTGSASPERVAAAIRDHFGLTEFYVADLDAILESRQNQAIYSVLADAGFRLMLDAGPLTPDTCEALLRLGVARLVVGLETCPSPGHLDTLVAGVGTDRIVFSLDLRGGSPMSPTPLWPATPLAIAEAVEACGIGDLIVLDLADVGVGGGVSTIELLKNLRIRIPGMKLTAGGGVRSLNDLIELEEVGVHAALVASALHNGALTPGDLQGLSERDP
jgi:phosphoribosylformimino-5-aminoimidazole carboxamide ribotide isomerase